MRENVAFKKAVHSLYNRAFFFNVVHLNRNSTDACVPPSQDVQIGFIFKFLALAGYTIRF